MSKNLGYSGEKYAQQLADLARNTEIARWALYEIKSNSEAGRAIKSIIHLIITAETLSQPKPGIDTDSLVNNLKSLGFKADLIQEVILKLRGSDNTIN